VQSLELEHYPGMTEKAIESMIDAAMRRFDILRSAGDPPRRAPVCNHGADRAGRGDLGASGGSFQACEFLMDYLKTQAPFWKKEQTPEGARWVDARVADDAALERWGIVARNSPEDSRRQRGCTHAVRHGSGRRSGYRNRENQGISRKFGHKTGLAEYNPYP
jgi:molybdopterin synthase catalytic subunit